MTMNPFETLMSMAIDSTAALTAGDRYRRLLDALRNVIPYDAAALLRLDGDAMVPVATRGLSPDTMGRRFLLRAHPRLDIICKSDSPVHFPAGSRHAGPVRRSCIQPYRPHRPYPRLPWMPAEGGRHIDRCVDG